MLAGVLELAFLVAVQLLIDQFLPGQDWNLIALAGASLLALYLCNTGLLMIVTYWGHILGISIETEMHRKSFDR